MRSPAFIIVLAGVFLTLGSGAAAAPYLVRGQVVTADGALPGATVRLVHKPSWMANAWPEDRPNLELLEPIETSSGEDGRFELAVEVGEIDPSNASWLLEVSAPELARRTLEVPPYGRKARAGATEELGGVLLSPGVLVRGQVVGEAGDRAALAGVRVSLWRPGGGTPWTATTGNAGGFQILDVPAWEYHVVLDRPGFAPRNLEHRRIHGSAAADLGTIVLSEALPLHGQVVDARGKPLAGARVRFRHDLPSGAHDWLPVQAAETGLEGEFRLEGLPPEPGPFYLFRFDKPGYRWRFRELEIVPAAGGLRLASPVALDDALFLTGRVSDPSGEPIAGAQVTPVPGEQTYGAITTHQTDAGGRFRIDHVEAVTGRLHVQARGFAAREVELEASELVSIVLQPAATTDLTIVVRDAREQPVAGAEIYFTTQDDGSRAYHATGLTDDAGRHPLDHVPLGGPCSLEVRHPEQPHWWRSDLVVEADQQTLAVDLAPAPWELETVRGRVSDGEDSPIPGAEVSLSPPHRTPEYRARAGDDGRFELRRVKEGAYQLIATAPGRAPAALPVKVAAGLEPLAVVLGPGAVLRGTLSGVPPATTLETRVYGRWQSEMREAIIDGESYRIDHLGTGKWSVTASAGDSYLSSEIEIEPGQTEARLDFEFPLGHRVRGQLLIDGQPPPPSNVSLQTAPEAPAAGSYSATTDGGRFVFDRVVAGPYQLFYTSETGSIQRQILVDSEVDLFLDVHTVRLRGRLLDAATGTGVAGVTVHASPEIQYSHGPRWEAVSDPAGWFGLGRVLPGTWTLFVKTPGFLEQRLVVAVDALTEPPVIELTASEGLRVRVETSTPLPYSIELQLRDADGERVAQGHVTLAGTPEGHWSEAPRGRFRLWASNELSWIATDAEIPGPVVTLTFPPAGALRLRVPELELESGVPWKPAVPVQVQATLELPDNPAFDGPHHRRARFLRLKSLTPGRWRIEVRTADGRTWTGNALVVDGRSSEVLLGME